VPVGVERRLGAAVPEAVQSPGTSPSGRDTHERVRLRPAHRRAPLRSAAPSRGRARRPLVGRPGDPRGGSDGSRGWMADATWTEQDDWAWART